MVMQKCFTNSGLTIHGNQVKTMAVRSLKYIASYNGRIAGYFKGGKFSRMHNAVLFRG